MRFWVESPETGLRPYRGAEPYRFEHGELFFGRDAAARLITEKIFGTPVTVLHAPSGAGKTSLLNTRILPGVEANGLTPVLVRLWESPVESVLHEISNQAFPQPAREVECVEAACEAAGLEDETGLATAVDRFDGFRRDHPEQAAEVMASIRGDVPFFARLLNRTLELERYLEIVNFVIAGGLWPPGDLPSAHRQLLLGDLRRSLAAPEAARAHREFVDGLKRGATSIAALVERVCEVCNGALRDFELLLCFDQFEEIFTRFHSSTADHRRAPGAKGGAEIREEFLGELKVLCREAFLLEEYMVGAGGASSRHRLPVRLLFSLRDEFFARMDWLKEVLREGFTGSHHLGLLRPAEARQAIVEPAATFGVEYEPACLDRILADLTIEGRIEPSQLSIVCDRLWSRAVDNDDRELTLAKLEREGFVEGLLESIVADTLAGLNLRERLEALDIIAELQIEKPDGAVRQIVREDQLKHRALRTEIRDRVVEDLKNRYFLRLHRYRGSTLIEVTHEALLRAFNRVLAEQRARHPEFFHMTPLLNRLLDQEQQAARLGAWPRIHRRDLEVLEEIADYVDWIGHPGTCELVLRSWLELEETSGPEWRAAVARWARLYGAAVAAEQADDPRAAFLRHPSRWRLQELESAADGEWSESERAAMLQALVRLDHTAHATLISEWTRRTES